MATEPLTPEEMVAIENEILARKIHFSDAIRAVHRHDDEEIGRIVEGGRERPNIRS